MTDLTVYARRSNGTIAGQLTNWDELRVVDRWRNIGRWSLVTTDAGEAAHWDTRDAGIVVMRGSTVILSGVADYRQISYSGGATTTVVSGPDDGWVLRNLAWGDPDVAIGSQVTAADKRTGYPDALLIGYVNDNLNTRLGMSLTMPSTASLGTSRTYRVRFRPLVEVGQELFAADPALGFRMAQQADHTVGLEIWTASDLTGSVALFSDETGIAYDWTYTEMWPEATRAIIGGSDVGASRYLRAVTASTAETNWDRIIETFVDRRDVDNTDPTVNAEMDEAGEDALNDAAPSETFRLQVNEDTDLKYGTDYRVGDLVRAYPAGVQVDDRITEAELVVTRDGGEVVTVWVGRKDDDPDERVERRAVQFDKRLRRLETGA